MHPVSMYKITFPDPFLTLSYLITDPVKYMLCLLLNIKEYYLEILKSPKSTVVSNCLVSFLCLSISYLYY